jgi:hypothetical protein
MFKLIIGLRVVTSYSSKGARRFGQTSLPSSISILLEQATFQLEHNALIIVKVSGYFRLRNVNIVVFLLFYLIVTCFGHTTIFK